MKPILALLLALALTGCATTAGIQKELYEARVAEQSKVDQEKQKTAQERYKMAQKLTDPSAQLAFAISDGIAQALAATGAGQQQLPAMPAIEGWDDKALRLIGALAGPASNIGLGIVQANVAREGIRANKDIALGDQQARVDTIAAVTQGMATLGSRPTTVVNGNNNAVNGSTANNSTNTRITTTTTTTSTNNCTSGNGAPGGNSGSGGPGGEAGGGGNSTAGNAAPSGQVPCSIQK